MIFNLLSLHLQFLYFGLVKRNLESETQEMTQEMSDVIEMRRAKRKMIRLKY